MSGDSRRRQQEQRGPERRRLRDALALEGAQLAELFMQAPAFIAVLRGPDHVFELANPKYYELIGDREILGKPAREALPEVEAQGFIELLDTVYQTGESYVGDEVRIELRPHADEPVEEWYLNFVYQPLRGDDDAITGIFAHGYDVTAQVRARQEAEAANRAKADFLATMSHELRTPLNAIIGYTDLLRLGISGQETTPEQYLDRIGLSAHHLLQLIEEILTYARVEAGSEHIEWQDVELHDLAEEAIAIIEPLAADKGVVFRAETPSEPVSLRTDPRKLRQILLNVTGNAVKFTDEGEIVFRARVEEPDLVIEISDTGIGIAPEDLPNIWDPFYQADSGPSRRLGGTGLGLSVTRQLARMLGGDADVRSTPGEGSTFTIRLPLQPRGEQPQPAIRSKQP